MVFSHFQNFGRADLKYFTKPHWAMGMVHLHLYLGVMFYPPELLVCDVLDAGTKPGTLVCGP